MQAIINFFRGSVLFTVMGAFPERFLNLCAQRGIGFWDLEWEDAHSLHLRVSRRDAKRLKELGERVMCEVTPQRRMGVPFFLMTFRKRYGLLLGLALAIAAVGIFSRFILTIEVSGNEKVPTAAILTELSRQGVRVGVYGPGLDTRRISQEALIELTDLSWMSVNLHGTRAEVLVRENLPEPELRDETTPANVVSAATGIITHMEVLDGQAVFQEGDTVLEGEILISGVMDLKEPKYSEIDAGQRIVHARGNIYARTWRTLEAAIPLEAEVKRYTGEEKTQWEFVALGHSVNFFGKAGISPSGYDKITTSHVLMLPGGRVMPLALRKTEYRAYDTVSVPLEEPAAQTLLEDRLLLRLSDLIGETGEVISTGFSARKSGGMLVVALQAECREQIGREVTFEGTVGDIP